jgi:hypothetical protein
VRLIRMLCPLNIVVFVKLNSEIQKTKKERKKILSYRLLEIVFGRVFS